MHCISLQYTFENHFKIKSPGDFLPVKIKLPSDVGMEHGRTCYQLAVRFTLPLPIEVGFLVSQWPVTSFLLEEESVSC